MEVTIAGIVFLGITLVVRRREAFHLRWQPTRHTWAAVGTGLLAFALSAFLLLLRSGSVGAALVHYGLIYVVCGAAIPWGYALLVERETPAALGLRRGKWALSLVLSAVAAGLFVPVLFLEGDLAAVGWGNVAEASLVLTGAGGLFLLTSALYVLWHVGTQLPLEPDPLLAIWKLFWVGVMSQSLFALTRNLLVIWPLFHAVGVMLDFAVNIDAVSAVAGRLPWALGAMIAMIATAVVMRTVRARIGAGRTTTDHVHSA